MIEYGLNNVGTDAQIFEPVTLGFLSRENISKGMGYAFHDFF
jgi:hypothetical protein